MKKIYVAPVMSVTKFQLNDIITASGETPEQAFKTSDGRTVTAYDGTGDSMVVSLWDA